MDTKFGDTVIKIIANAIMIISYIPQPFVKKIVARTDGTSGTGATEIIGWKDLTKDKISKNINEQEKFNKLILELAYKSIESTYGCFLLIIDRYRSVDKSLYAIVGSGS